MLLDGVEATAYSAAELAERVGLLPPMGVIFRGTIYENLSRFGGIERERVMEVARLVGIDEEVRVLPAGYDTQLEGGTADPIPPGLRQRIAIARVLMTKPRLILFYNADRALDRDGYNTVFRLLARLKGVATLVLVTEDRNILDLADRHYQLTDRHVEDATPGQQTRVRAQSGMREFGL